MITDNTNGRLDEIRTYATKNNLLDSFNRAFSRFESYSNDGYMVNLYSDFAPLSMMFSITKNDKQILNGGFIFHGPHDGYGSGSAPTFSVSLTREVGWSIHT